MSDTIGGFRGSVISYPVAFREDLYNSPHNKHFHQNNHDNQLKNYVKDTDQTPCCEGNSDLAGGLLS